MFGALVGAVTKASPDAKAAVNQAELLTGKDIDGDGLIGGKPAKGAAAPAAAASSSSASRAGGSGHASSSAAADGAVGAAHGENLVTASHYAANTSQCTGNKKALLIGINYISHETGRLNGCINDTVNIENYLIKEWGYRKENIRRYNDDNEQMMPTRENMLNGMKWLVEGASAGDCLFMHYSGHGSQTAPSMMATVLESTGKDNTICPLDYDTAGQITDNEIHALCCKKLPAGVRLTVIFDSCHSGSAMDLPYEYNAPKGDQFHNANKAGTGIGGFMSRHGNINFGCISQGIQGIALEAGKHVGTEVLHQGASFVRPRLNAALNETKADVIMISGCRDDQTSADATLDGSATGAMSYALLTVLRREKKTNYSALIFNMRDLLHNGERKFTQMPCLSFGRNIDPDMEVYI